jgi:hypothetical protein
VTNYAPALFATPRIAVNPSASGHKHPPTDNSRESNGDPRKGRARKQSGFVDLSRISANSAGT